MSRSPAHPPRQVLTNLAHQYAKNELYTEALNTYQVITKNKNFNNAGRLKVNMGNIYYKLGQFPKALKFYRMALDQIPSGQSSTKYGSHSRLDLCVMCCELGI